MNNQKQGITCTYCGQPAKLIAGHQLYKSKPELSKTYFWRCAACDAFTGCYPKTKTPNGNLSNAAGRTAKAQARAAFNPLWLGNGPMSYKQATTWLADALKLPESMCNIGLFEPLICARVVVLCAKYIAEHRKPVL